MTKFDQRYPSARTGSGKASRPRGVHKISQIGLDNIGVDEEGRLYWNGQMVKEANPLELRPTGSCRAQNHIQVSAIDAVVLRKCDLTSPAQTAGERKCTSFVFGVRPPWASPRPKT